MNKTWLKLSMASALSAALLAVLGGCTSLPRNPDVDTARPGVTVYGTVDAGVSHTSR